MKYRSLIVFLLMLIHKLDVVIGTPETEVTYDELKELNATCPPEENCLKGMLSDRCSCKSSCAQFGTCCLDSSTTRYTPAHEVWPTCRSISIEHKYAYGFTGYFMVDQCPQNGSKSIYEDLCREEWDGQNDIMSIVPVASLSTHITYKNYFCFRCHELNDDYMFWKVHSKFKDGGEPKDDTFNVQLRYNSSYKTWEARVGQDDKYFAVDIDIVINKPIHSITKPCHGRLISNCSEDWLDDVVRSKCEVYTYLTNITRDGLTLEYRNPHCALCNFESLNDVYCIPSSSGGSRGGGSFSGGEGTKKNFSFTLLLDINPYEGDTLGKSTVVKKLFSYTFVIDINPSDGDFVGKRLRCRGDKIWDPFFNKCRTLTCALPGYRVKDGLCIPP